jgi:hypothetical protein
MNEKQPTTNRVLKVFYGALFLLSLSLIYPAKINPEISFAGTSQDWCIYILSLILALLTAFPIIWPITLYFNYGQTARISRIKGFFSVSSIRYYLQRFWKADKACRDAIELWDKQKSGAAKDGLINQLDIKINETFGHDRSQQAMTFITLLTVVILFFTYEGGLQLAREGQNPHNLLGVKVDVISLAAIFGAYTWITSDVIYRYRQSDLGSSDLYWYALRLIVAIPLGQAIAKAAPTDSGALLAFVISMFSLPRIQQILGSLVNRIPGIPVTTEDARDDITLRLPGIDQRVSDKLSAEGVTTVSQLAAIDPVFLSSRAGIPFQLLLKYIDSAILWRLVGPKLLSLREFGWCGASDIISFAERQQQALIKSRVEKYMEAKSFLIKAISEQVEAQREFDKISAQIPDQTSAEDPLHIQAHDAYKDLKDKEEKKVAAEAGQNTALLAISASITPASELFSDISGKATISESGLSELIKVLSDDEYAQFIRHMLHPY